MDLLGFLRRRSSGPEAEAAPAAPVYRAPAWQAAAPLQRTVVAPHLITAPERFRAELTSWADPTLTSAPAHVVSPAAPSGLGHGLAVPAPQPRPVQRAAAEHGRTWWRVWDRGVPSIQRAADTASFVDEPADVPDVPDVPVAPDIPVTDDIAVPRASEGPRSLLPTVAAPPPSSGLVSAVHAPLPPPLRMSAVALQRSDVPGPTGPDLTSAAPTVRALAAAEVSEPAGHGAVQAGAVPAEPSSPSLPRIEVAEASCSHAVEVRDRRDAVETAPTVGSVAVQRAVDGPVDPPPPVAGDRSPVVSSAAGFGAGGPLQPAVPASKAAGAPGASTVEGSASTGETAPIVGTAVQRALPASAAAGEARSLSASAPAPRQRPTVQRPIVQRPIVQRPIVVQRGAAAEPPVTRPGSTATTQHGADEVQRAVAPGPGAAAAPPAVVLQRVVEPGSEAGATTADPSAHTTEAPVAELPADQAPPTRPTLGDGELRRSAPDAGEDSDPASPAGAGLQRSAVDATGVSVPMTSAPRMATRTPGPARRRFGLGAPLQRTADGGPGTRPRTFPPAAVDPVPSAARAGPVDGALPRESGPPPTVQRTDLSDVIAPTALAPLVGDAPLLPASAELPADPPSDPTMPAAGPSSAKAGAGTGIRGAAAGSRPLPAAAAAVQRAGAGSPPLPAAAAPALRTPASTVQRGVAPAAAWWQVDDAAVVTGLVGARSIARGPESTPRTSAPPTPTLAGPSPIQRSATAPLPDPAPPAAVPASVRRLIAAHAAQQAVQQAVVQRDAEAVPDAPLAPDVPPAPAESIAAAASPTAPSPTAGPVPAGAAASTGGQTDVDALVGRIYDPLVRRFKAELRLDRERAGHVLDLRQ